MAPLQQPNQSEQAPQESTRQEPVRDGLQHPLPLLPDVHGIDAIANLVHGIASGAS